MKRITTMSRQPKERPHELSAERSRSMMKLIETGIRIEGKELKLHPVDFNGQVLLYDIYLGEKWRGSRRTVNACGVYLGVPDLMKRLWG